MKTLIKNGHVITATDDYRADILIEGEVVSVIGARLDMEADVTIDAGGKLVIPAAPRQPTIFAPAQLRPRMAGRLRS